MTGNTAWWSMVYEQMKRSGKSMQLAEIELFARMVNIWREEGKPHKYIKKNLQRLYNIKPSAYQLRLKKARLLRPIP